MELTQFEQKCLNLIFEHSQEKEIFSEQLKNLNVVSRDIHETGFFTKFRQKRKDIEQFKYKKFIFEDVFAEALVDKATIGIILHIEDGYMYTLEGYLIGTGKIVDLDLKNYEFYTKFLK